MWIEFIWRYILMNNTHRLLTALIDKLGYEIEEFNVQVQKKGRPETREYLYTDFKLHDKPKKPKAKREKKEVEYSPEFEEAWKIYPKKNGNKKIAAYAAWKGWIGEVRPAGDLLIVNGMYRLMIDGTKRYAAYHKALGTSERHIHQGSTFFGREKLYMQDWDIPKQHTELKKPQDEEINQFAIDNELTYPAPTQCKTFDSYWKFLKAELEKKQAVRD